VTHPYEALTPDLILDAVAGLGLQPDGHLLALNSYENRVLQIGIDDRAPLVAKFYRPERWSSAAIREEHAFALECADGEIPVVPPVQGPGGETLFEHGGFRFALFERRGGRAPEPGDLDQLVWIGRFLGRIHMTGAAHPFRRRRSRLDRARQRAAQPAAAAGPGQQLRDAQRTVAVANRGRDRVPADGVDSAAR
jgi:Ser/Thr protein kinase RdoA (MazF antagonist)